MLRPSKDVHSNRLSLDTTNWVSQNPYTLQFAVHNFSQSKVEIQGCYQVGGRQFHWKLPHFLQLSFWFPIQDLAIDSDVHLLRVVVVEEEWPPLLSELRRGRRTRCAGEVNAFMLAESMLSFGVNGIHSDLELQAVAVSELMLTKHGEEKQCCTSNNEERAG